MRHSSFTREEKTSDGREIRQIVHVLEQRVGKRLAAQCFVVDVDSYEMMVSPRSFLAHQLIQARQSVRKFIKDNA